MTDFTVTATAYAPDESWQVEPEAYADGLLDAAAEYFGAVHAAAHAWELTLTMEAHDLHDALGHVWSTVTKIVENAGSAMPHWPVQGMSVVHSAITEVENSIPNAPDLVSGPEVAAILGVGKARVHQLAAENPNFPQPLYRLACGSLWTRPAIERFNETWERKVGRPRKPPMPAQPDGTDR